ncbi:TenA family protein [Actinomycetospora sp. TBRC 11914]|uniref:TenA family protein n=1 Tax=Actinomycetospora sp. TBRC 11914 TaxID=2729387 RepID=UPI00145CA6E1|nr:TenA family protein [Actinomycetospora sp. TBRC 11914]NMO91959.1 transcriptional regulator [Actinomycetospora sp. TBRC 11914]
MGFCDELRAAWASTWDAAVGHRFVDELWAGTVDDAVLARYLVQDLQFLDAFVALLGAAVASADRPGPRLVLARQLGLVAGDEDDYFSRALDRLGVPAARRRDPELLPPTRGFLALMDEARRSADHAEILTVLLVAEWLYADWAARDAALPADPLHAEWIELHRGEAFTAWVAFLRDEVDRVAAGGADQQRMAEVFGRAVTLELAFFDAAYG